MKKIIECAEACGLLGVEADEAFKVRYDKTEISYMTQSRVWQQRNGHLER